MSHSVVTFPSISEPMFPGKPSQDLADEEKRESEWADVPDVEVDSPGNIAMMMMITMIIMIPDAHGDPTVNMQYLWWWQIIKISFSVYWIQFFWYDHDWVTV